MRDIPIRIESPARTGGLGGGVAGILSEILGLLDAAVNGAPASMIDVRSLPMSPQDRDELEHALGDGEVHASLNADGVSTLRETGISGVWWVSHRDPRGELVAELIEVSRFPSILETTVAEMDAGARELRARMRASVDSPGHDVKHDTRQ